MKYIVYGILNESGSNTEIGSARSLKKALEIVKNKINPNTYPVFCIIERERRHSIEIAANIGRTNEGNVTIVCSLVTPVSHARFIRSQDVGQSFWQKYSHVFPKN